MKEVVVVSAVRSPIGSIGGSLINTQAEELAKVVIEGVINKIGLDKSLIDEIIIGQAKQSTDAPNIARLASLMAKLPEEIPSYTVHRQCASGMQAMVNGMQQIQCGYSDIVLVGGVESMSTAPFYLRDARFGVGNGNKFLIDPNTESQPRSQPEDIYGTFNMIETAENLAKKYNISRKEQDEFSIASQHKAIAAIDSGRFADEIVPVNIPQRKGEDLIFDQDEYPRRTTTIDRMSKLKAIFPNGTVTAGNASGRNDGASALILMSLDKANELGIRPLVKIIGASATGVDPRIMGLGPVPATQKLLDKLDMQINDFGLIEINEAFAAQSIACVKELKIDIKKLNVNGGAIALGHPIGCSGARISTTIIHELIKRKDKYGLATICVAGGLGMAIAFENMY